MHSFIYAVFFSVAVFLSVKMPTDFYTIYWSGVKWTDSLLFLGIVFVVYAIVVLCDFGLNRSEEYFTRTHSDRVLKRGCMVAFVCYAVLFLSWVVTFLAFYPGNISADSYSSIHQAVTHIDSTAHPVLFTLLVQFCLKIGLGLFGNMNAAIASCVVQRSVTPNEQWDDFRRLNGIPEDEQIVVMFALGKYKQTTKVPISKRFPVQKIYKNLD